MSSSAKHGKPANHPAERIFVGCSGWAYPSWKPGFYPAGLPAKKFLSYYASRLNSVEVNYTFRTLPTEKMIQGWLETVSQHNPDTPRLDFETGESNDFRFSFKAPQRITHILRLKNAAADLDAFLASLEPVRSASRLGVLLFQLPPNFKADLDRLAAFLEDCPRGYRIAFEFRHESWFEEPALPHLEKLLRTHKAALCMAESDELLTPDLATANFACYRLRRSTYAQSELDAIRTRIQSKAQQLETKGEVYAYFRHDEEPAGALRAAAVLEGLRTA
ncbi:DUF72 domain-containing protein [Silvibacterium dinghuense]|uniref:DUF72 domain-containing protein n=1 Tax=Silvibacterium dinghuense TaxID=1560006 RepID=UPI0013E97F6C|nr:DUF72 domain-containing protein [Silvibacterium dinghuense]